MPRVSEAAIRNEEPIRAVLEEFLSSATSLLEVGTGTGQHAVAFAKAFPHITWSPVDRPGFLDDVSERRNAAGLANLAAPRELDLLAVAEFLDANSDVFDALLAVNVIHIAPWEATAGLFALGASVLKDNGQVMLYGPYRYADQPFAPSNAAFDQSLRRSDPASGIRDFEAVRDVAGEYDFELTEDREMPANNRMLVWTRTQQAR